MAGDGGGQAPDIEAALLEQAKRFSFIQALRLLRLICRRQAGQDLDESRLSRWIRVRPQLSLDFPGTDIASIEKKQEPGTHYLVTATFFGLYGASSPLPTFYTEDLIQERNEGRSITRDFLDILNCPLYELLFRAWAKHQLLYQLVEEKDQDALDRLYCLLGLDGDGFRSQVEDSYRLLRYTGLASQLPRSAEGLRAMLADALGTDRVEVISCVEQMAPLPENLRLVLGARENVLGDNTVLGEMVPDRMGRFRIRIGPVDGNRLHDFLPDGQLFARIRELVRFYLDQPLEWDLEIILEPGQVQSPVLGRQSWARLGWNTWLAAEPGRECHKTKLWPDSNQQVCRK